MCAYRLVIAGIFFFIVAGAAPAQTSHDACQVEPIAPAENKDSVKILNDNETCLQAEAKRLQRDLADARERLDQLSRSASSSVPIQPGPSQELQQLDQRAGALERRLGDIEAATSRLAQAMRDRDAAQSSSPVEDGEIAALKHSLSDEANTRMKLESALSSQKSDTRAALASVSQLEQSVHDLQARAEAESQARRQLEDKVKNWRQPDFSLTKKPVVKNGIEITPGQAVLSENGGIITANLTIRNISPDDVLILLVGMESTFVLPDIRNGAEVFANGIKKCHHSNGTSTCVGYEDYEFSDVSSQQSIVVQVTSRLEGKTKASVVSLNIHMLVRIAGKTFSTDFQLNEIEVK